MEYANHLNEYTPAWSQERVDEEVARIRKVAESRNHNTEVYKFCYSAIDLTTLSCNDSAASVTEFARKAVEFYQAYPHIPNVASICIYPAFVETVGVAVDGTPMRITSVAGGFPASQTFLEVKALEVAMAVENGADEIDIVLNVGRMLTGEYDEAANEVEVIRAEMDSDIILKVIIESGALKSPELIRKASLLSMLAGADFVKTSTGKIDVAATPEAAVVMCQAIRDYYEKTGRKVGFKAAGGVRTPRRCRTLLHDRRGDPRQGVAHDRPVPHRRFVGGQQPALGHRRQDGEILLTPSTGEPDADRLRHERLCAGKHHKTESGSSRRDDPLSVWQEPKFCRQGPGIRHPSSRSSRQVLSAPKRPHHARHPTYGLGLCRQQPDGRTGPRSSTGSCRRAGSS